MAPLFVLAVGRSLRCPRTFAFPSAFELSNQIHAALLLSCLTASTTPQPFLHPVILYRCRAAEGQKACSTYVNRNTCDWVEPTLARSALSVHGVATSDGCPPQLYRATGLSLPMLGLLPRMPSPAPFCSYSQAYRRDKPGGRMPWVPMTTCLIASVATGLVLETCEAVGLARLARSSGWVGSTGNCLQG
ncbi:hypothetical protein BGZ61DRAFT_207993 [Ilyonectria robusta]|uniref:uncharacterized protein n=1 Tax=Ilyonectria robusta TaxID=1079257 RepID=UPI001E8E4716|nr:uncharacterized protein BGZ61DRAFT_207993 [Ilyonectria robusta]KAH8714213.1 hypothetical protein BGZ61DRAFT_207993 [Ilyonectria robusta]